MDITTFIILLLLLLGLSMLGAGSWMWFKGLVSGKRWHVAGGAIMAGIFAFVYIVHSI